MVEKKTDSYILSIVNGDWFRRLLGLTAQSEEAGGRGSQQDEERSGSLCQFLGDNSLGKETNSDLAVTIGGNNGLEET
jgi:hypothetical protein